MSPPNPLYCGRFTLELDRPAVMGIVNLTPDSFSGDGVAKDISAALRRVDAQIQAGADVIDLGAESSRPGAMPLAQDDELARLLPVLRALRDTPVPISVDTYKPDVMKAALDEGASIINDINAFRANGAIEVVKGRECALCVMHMQGAPLVMQAAPEYRDVVAEVADFLDGRLAELESMGIARSRCWIDPGFGFGKRLIHNLSLVGGLPGFAKIAPTLVGVSRKSMLGELTGRAVEERLVASVVAASYAALSGAAVVRVHDVAATRDGLAIAMAFDRERKLYEARQS